MSVLGLQEYDAPGSEELARTIGLGVLNPIPGDRPSGEYSRTAKLALEKIDPKKSDSSGSQESPGSDFQAWKKYRDALEGTLSTTTKDLELGVFLAEANARVFGFDGLRDGFWVVTGLIKGFVHQGLHPQWEDGDLSAHHSSLEWFKGKLPGIISEIPLTRRSGPGTNYSLGYLKESRQKNGRITPSQFEQAAEAGPTQAYKMLAASVRQAQDELARLNTVATEAYGSEAPSFAVTQEHLQECKLFAEEIVQRRAKKEAQVSAARTVAKPSSPSGLNLGGLSSIPMGSSSDDAWAQCEQMASSGNVDGAITAMAALAARESCGRVRFQRRLMLADLCLQSNRKKLAARILEELNQIINDHKLEEWESAEMIGGVWTRLVRCYRDKAAGTRNRDKEAELFARLSRLDPWQAVECGEPKEESA